ncbi:hypothetical protein SAMN02745216_00578 [Desulfatibacillum alkenivorans DSM 16219]|uniref:Uncharacterized protein n=1 Tax=Desulfatibacillum alkenivorans DSM 16219 TaxID=1121393 RepID=A0A1M6E707_9BACT|nr:hypothetical protein SAMN02745216_00578 [Desulfatibacillum alkenivorans DSM 16219]
MQSQVKIVYCPGDSIKPAFGLADTASRTVYVSRDLPGPVKDFVLKHELFHIKDRRGFWFWREAKANMAAGFEHPLGFCWCALMSLQPYRLRFYLRRFIKGF